MNLLNSAAWYSKMVIFKLKLKTALKICKVGKKSCLCYTCIMKTWLRGE